MTTKFKQLINPHQHSDASLDGASTIEQIVKKSKALGATHVAITEHGNMNSNMELYHVCQKNGMKPILGIELYLQPPHQELLKRLWEVAYDRRASEDEAAKADGKKSRSKKMTKEEWVSDKLANEYVHLTVHFKDEIGYNYFTSISPKMEARGVLKWGERKPIATLEELQGASGHITICSGCLIGIVQKWILPHRGLIKFGEDLANATVKPELAVQAYEIVRNIAGADNFFVEVFPHRVTHEWKRPIYDKETKKIIQKGQFIQNECSPRFPDGDLQRLGNHLVYHLAKKYGDKVIISLDSHFAEPQQKLIQDAKLGNGQESWRFYTSYHIMSTNDCVPELKAIFGVDDKTIEGWVDNSYDFASRFDNFKLTTSKDRWIIDRVDGDFMIQLKKAIDRHGRMDWSNPQMLERLKYEISVLALNDKINLMGYMFRVESIANWCRENDVLMTVRGSAGGSLMLYLLGVSAVNPLEYDLSFERFLTLGRIKANTLPDVDMDISTGGRDRLITHLEEELGDRICRLSIDTMLKLKSSIKDAERAILGYVTPATEALCRALPSEPQGTSGQEFVFGRKAGSGEHVPGVLETNPKLKAYADNNPEIWATVSEMLGVQRQKGTHACGVIITDKPVQEYMPVITIGETKATAYSPKWVEAAGGVKYDLLGLNTLWDIEDCLKSIKERLGITIDPWRLPKDEKVFDQFCEGNTVGVFQFDTDTVRPFLTSIRPRSISALAAITALARPGTLDAPNGDGRTLAQVYVERCRGEEIQYVHPDMAEITGETMGIQLYQEQTMKIFSKLGGYTDEQTDEVRRGIGKKIEKVLAEATGNLKKHCMSRGWTEQQVDLLIEQIMASSRYSFNKSHAVSYAQIAYACMWLKINYPLDWWKSVLSHSSKGELSTKFWKHVKDFTTMPDINIASDGFKIDGDRLVSPISIMNGVGEKAYEQLVSNAPYKDLESYVAAHHSKRSDGTRSSVNQGVSHKLIAGGILDSLFARKDMSVDDKIYEFQKVKAAVRKEKVEAVPEEFVGMTVLGQYLIKKELISIYSEDLREIMLPNRGCRKSTNSTGGVFWIGQDGTPIFDGVNLMEFKAKADMGLGLVNAQTGQGIKFAVVGYVVEEKPLQYKNKTKTATKMIVDCGGTFYEEVLWPSYGTDVADNGFKHRPVILIYESTADRVYLKKVSPMLEYTEETRYNVV